MAAKAEYDDIVEGHDEYRAKSNPIWIHEVENVKQTLTPLIQGAKVLELACGSGFYSYDMMSWGASSVLGVDISSGMLEAARRLPEATTYGDKVSFLHADCTQGQTFPGAPFDVVFAAYLLPHAPDRETMVQMYRTIAVNLKDGGHFVGVVSPVSEDPLAYFQQEKENMAKFGLTAHRQFVKEIRDGITYRIRVKGKEREQFFYGYRLRQSVYEAAAKEAGFQNPVQWISLQEPEIMAKSEDKTSLPPELQKQVACPDFGLLQLKK
jgi:ubiquinone/menaquinone biosynthesis C-methylase UbiE